MTAYGGVDIVTCKSIARLRPQHTHGQQYAAAFSLCLCSLHMRNDVTQQCLEMA
jgi:hypothetical protein